MHGVSKATVEMVKTYVQSKGMKSPFNNDTPGYDFMIGFEKRWSEQLTRRKPELLTKARAEGLTQFVVDEFFNMYETILKDNNLENHPERIFNLDETGLGTDPTKGKVLVPKSARSAYLRAGGAGKLQYSVLFVASASGETYPPCVIYKATGGLQSIWTHGGPPGTFYSSTESGWMQDYVFEKWLTKFVQVQHIEKPILVTFDGHGSHLTYNVTKIAQENGLILLCLPPNTSHALQPLDVGVFGPMKTEWKNILKNWYRQSRLKNIDKAIFPSLLKQLLKSSFKSEHVIGGFKGSGLYPVNKHAVDGKIVTVESSSALVNNNEQPSTSSAANNTKCITCSSQIDTQPHNQPTSPPVSPSPMKKLREAILQTISPEQTPEKTF
ncbi:uncharacterized protein LOC108253432 [Diaphorina citri]|uniref:Uncharacterized protein LOC108253432 n=1 Tax=Diaphorina citri TaxID=121845 RepID=A0A1S4EL17_DIACI|nr:uncharacterized protein LOC108253432 [Diaphorina citri]